MSGPNLASYGYRRKPPHLRPCGCCEQCKNYNGHYRCLMYDWPVDDDDTCDSFEATTKSKATKRLRETNREEERQEGEA